MKISISLDIDSTAVVKWETTTLSSYDKNIAFPLLDSVRDYSYVMINVAYESSSPTCNTTFQFEFLQVQDLFLFLCILPGSIRS